MELGPEYFMKQALKLADNAFAEDEVPIGAVVVAENRIIGKGYNQVERLNDPTAHAEMLAITAASSFLNSKYLNDCTIYVTVEPCLMCFGAIQNARIKEVFIGCNEPRHGFSNFINNPPKTVVKTGYFKEECLLRMQAFFEKKR